MTPEMPSPGLRENSSTRWAFIRNLITFYHLGYLNWDGNTGANLKSVLIPFNHLACRGINITLGCWLMVDVNDDEWSKEKCFLYIHRIIDWKINIFHQIWVCDNCNTSSPYIATWNLFILGHQHKHTCRHVECTEFHLQQQWLCNLDNFGFSILIGQRNPDTHVTI